MVYRFMSEHRGEYTIREMAVVFGVSSSACYKWAKREASGGNKEGDGPYPIW
jgi:transposase